jgi:hypothetical protein
MGDEQPHPLFGSAATASGSALKPKKETQTGASPDLGFNCVQGILVLTFLF